jgi:hypothetical protein
MEAAREEPIYETNKIRSAPIKINLPPLFVVTASLPSGRVFPRGVPRTFLRKICLKDT